MDIRLQNLTKIFRDNKKENETRAVDNLDIVIPSGKLVGLLGPSGCGKSTTLYMISGLLEPTSGKIFFGDEDVTELSPEKRGIGLVFQNYALYPHMTVFKNIAFPLENLKVEEQVKDKNGNDVTKKRRLKKTEIEEMVYSTAKLVQIENLLDRKPNQLSGGQQQRVAIARALVKRPKVLLLDEPLSNLDARLRLQTREEIKRIQRDTGITTIFVTHDQEEAMSISDKIVVMKLGVMQQMDTPQNVYNNPKNLFVAMFLGTPPINVFKGYIKDKVVYIGDDAVAKTEKDIKDQDLFVAIRPEGFIADNTDSCEFKLACDVDQIQILGRDISIVAKNEHCTKPTLKAIVSNESTTFSGKIKLGIKQSKIYIFDAETEDRIYLD